MKEQALAKQNTSAASTAGMVGVLRRKCDCGTHTIGGGACGVCSDKQKTIQRHPAGVGERTSNTTEVPTIVNDVLRSSGQPLDAATRSFMEPRFGHDFSRVRVYTDARAAESARAVSALAYTVGQNVVFGAGQYSPESAAGRHLLAHELTHVVQQEGAAMAVQIQRQVEPTAGGGYRIAVAPALADVADAVGGRAEAEADAVADRVAGADSLGGGRVEVRQRARTGIHRARIPLPIPQPLCGRTLTHIDIEAPRTRPLLPCTAQPVTRMNIVGREVSAATTGRGRIIFNLHIGYFRDATGHFCGVVDDSMTCVAPRCLMLGCFPTMQEVLDAIWGFIKGVLTVIGIIILIIGALILRGLRGAPSGGTAPAPVIAGAGGREGEGGGAGGGEGEGATAEA